MIARILLAFVCASVGACGEEPSDSRQNETADSATGQHDASVRDVSDSEAESSVADGLVCRYRCMCDIDTEARAREICAAQTKNCYVCPQALVDGGIAMWMAIVDDPTECGCPQPK